MVTMGVFACSAWLMWRRTSLSFSLWSALWLLLGIIFFISSLVQSSSFAAFKLFYLLFWFVGALALLIGEQIDWDDLRVSELLAGILLCAALVCAVGGFLRHFDLLWGGVSAFIPLYNSERMLGLIGHSNYFAFVCLLGVLAVAWLFQQRSIGLVGALSSSLIFIVCIVLTWTRSVVVSWFLLVLLLSLQHRKLSANRFMGILCGGLIALALLQPFGGALSQFLGGGAVNAMVDERMSVFGGKGVDSSGRLVEWGVAWRLFCDNPFFGVGIGNYGGEAFSKHIELGVLSPAGFFLHSHNILLQFLAEMGFFGGVWIFLFCILGVVGWWRAAVDVGRVLPACILLVFSVYSLFEFPFWVMHFFVLNLLVLGALGSKKIKISLRLGGVFSAIFAFIFFAISVVYLPLVERFYWSLRQYLVRAPVTASDYRFVDSLIRDPLMEPYGYLVYLANFEVSPKTAQLDIKMLGRLKHHFPYEPVLARLAILQFATGDSAGSFKTVSDLRTYYGDGAVGHIASQLGEAKAAFPEVDFSALAGAVGQ